MSNDTLASATQNLVIAFNALSTTHKFLAGQFTSDSTDSVAGATVLVSNTKGRLINVCVAVSGAGTISFYNQNFTSPLQATKLMYVLPANANYGVYSINQVFDTGLVMVVQAGVSANCTYSLGQ
jgi:hypothetical protein